jgi:hypothetical protein
MVRTYTVHAGNGMKTNVTISADEEVVRRARDVARQQGSTLNAMLRRYLEVLAGRGAGSRAAEELLELYRTSGGRSGGRRIARDEAYERSP